MGIKKISFILLGSIMLFAQTETQNSNILVNYDFIQKTEYGGIDWTKGIIVVTGIGAPNPDLPVAAQRPGAIRAAKLDAFRNVLEIIKGVYIDAQTTVENAMTASDVISTRIQGIIRNFTVTDIRYMSDGSIEVDVEVPITGDMTATLLPPEMGGMNPIIQPQQGGIYTGLIIDARGLKVQPAMAPKILTPDGVEVYGTGFVSHDYAIKMGIVGYAKNFNQARQDERVKPNPLIIKGIGVTGTNKTDIIISPNDAMKIHQYSENLNFLQQCRVLVIVD